MDQTCPGCGAFTLFVTEPVYDGFEKVGDRQKCTQCGHVLAETDPEIMVGEAKPGIFSDDELPEKPEVFDESDTPTFCRHCVHYIVNPFTQRCGLHDKEVQATDTCGDFEEKGDDGDPLDVFG